MNENYSELMLAELVRMNAKLDTRIDEIRSETRTSFAVVHTVLADIRREMSTRFADMSTEFSNVHKELKVIREQTALNSEEITSLERRVNKSPSA